MNYFKLFIPFLFLFLVLCIGNVLLQSYDYEYDAKKFLDGIKEEENYDNTNEESTDISSSANINGNLLELKSPADIYVEYVPKNLPEKLNLTKLRLKAYALHKNKKIIEAKDVSKYNQLKWMTYGYIRLVQIKKTPTSHSTEYFEFTREYISIQVEMLTDEQKALFVEAIKLKYNIEVKPEQIQNLVLKNFECITQFKDEVTSRFSLGLVGRANNLDRFPLRIDFKAREGTRERKILENKISQSKKSQDLLGLRFDCELLLDEKADKQPEDQLLQIKMQELLSAGLVDSLFGKSYLVYVMHEQLVRFARELYMKFNILNEYRANEGEFVDLFLEDLTKHVSVKDIQFIDFNKINEELSSYGLEEKNSQPKLIKSQLSNLFTIKLDNKKQRIISNNLLTQLNIGSLFKENNDLKEAIDYFLEENDNEKSLPLDQQLKKLNSITYNHIEWYLDSSGIVDPKKVKVFRLEKSKFLNRSLVFEKLKLKKQSSHQIVKRFGLFTMKTSEFCSPKETLKLVEQKNEMYNENQDLITKVNDMKKILDDYKDEVAKNLIPSISTSPIPETKTRSSFSYENTTEVYQPFKNTLTLRGHIDSVSALVFDEKNERLISSSVNIKIWDLVSGKCLHTFYNVHNDSINVLKLSSDGKILISGSNDGTIKILSLVEDDWYNNAYTLNEDKNTDRILSLVYYEPVNIIAGTHLGEIYVYYFEEDIEMKTIRGHEDAVYDLVLDENSNRLISASGDSTIKFWDLKTWENIGTFKAHQNSVLKLIFNQETGCLFSFSKNSNNNEIKSWNLGKERNSLQSVILNEFNFTSNGTFNFGLNSQKQILTFPYNQPAKVWEYQTGANINKFYLNVYDNSKVSELIITKKDKLIIGYENGIIRVWE